ncbi:helix-turn-helix domain-containing protein [Amaricoccus sp.]|uniref:helix-turn-helix domain-containing protein n=1 Tax=Amaricoccus sp. TaxID=1872485 RepID=UPI001B4CB8A7|nr:helix-turn-helix domain-containing protein [Amaricoccus sp.]MBP7001690.1 hypothetical protein [Amaricoccus sp.]
MPASPLAVEVEGKTLDQALRDFEGRLLAHAMNRAECNKAEAAEALGITVRRLNARLRAVPIRYRAAVIE